MSEDGYTKQEDSIYNILRTDILDLKLRPGLVFSIKDLGEAYQVGRTPVRDALISLQQEGLITFLPQRGTMISKLDYDKITNERFMRISIETNVMLEFMATCDVNAITEIELSLSRQEKLLKAQDIRAFLAEDIYFHSIFYYGAGKGHSSEILSANSGHYRRMRLLAMSDMGIDKKILEEHKLIVDAVLSKDSELLHRILNQHLNCLVNTERRLMSKHSDLFDLPVVETRRLPDGLVVDYLINAKTKNRL